MMQNLQVTDLQAIVANRSAAGDQYISRNDVHKNTGCHVEYAFNRLVDMGTLIKEVVPNTGAIRYKIA